MPLKTYTQEQLVKFFESHGMPCQMCGHNEWLATSIDQPIVNGLLAANGSYNFPPDAVLTFAIVCQKCGYLRQHEEKTVKKWIDEHHDDG